MSGPLQVTEAMRRDIFAKNERISELQAALASQEASFSAKLDTQKVELEEKLAQQESSAQEAEDKLQGEVDSLTRELAELEAIQKEIDAAVAVLREEYDDLGRDVQRIDDRIASNETYMRRLAANSVGRDAQGNLVQLPLPPEYYNAQRENEELARERQRLGAPAAQLDQAAARERAKMPRPPYTGRLTPINEDGVPVTLPPEPAADDPPSPEPSPTSQPQDGPLD